MSITPPTWMITPADVALGLFTLCNTMRVFAYVPQIVRIRQDQQGASAISYTTWGLFLISNLSTVAYGLLVVNDWRLVAVFAANTFCCVAILGLTAWKRAVFKAARQLASVSSGSPSPIQDTVTRADRDLIQIPIERPSGHARLEVIRSRAS
jgi:uncharacterized protein with PQ loop repeat